MLRSTGKGERERKLVARFADGREHNKHRREETRTSTELSLVCADRHRGVSEEAQQLCESGAPMDAAKWVYNGGGEDALLCAVVCRRQ